MTKNYEKALEAWDRILGRKSKLTLLEESKRESFNTPRIKITGNDNAKQNFLRSIGK